MTQAATAEAYQQAIDLAAQGHDQQASTALGMLIETLPQQSIWLQRMQAAQQLIMMRIKRSPELPPFNNTNPYLNLASNHIDNNTANTEADSWPITVLATVFPGAGHAWLGRWHDAYTAALMVWPMLLLTLWALKRSMGPVTVFFALITIWLWSGTVFSAISLAERGNLEHYLIWWQQVWLAAALPGRPW